MKYKWRWSLIVVAMIAICLYIVLSITDKYSMPASLPTENHLKKMILETGEVHINTFFEHIALDDKHVFVPHLSNDKHYGYSLVEWIDNKWEVTYVTSSGQPFLWRIGEKNQSESYFLWNLETKDDLDHITFYLIKNRDYTSGWGGEYYEPAIQMEEVVSMSGKSYGIYKVPDEWENIWKATQIKVEIQEEDLFSSNGEELHYGVKGYDKENNYVLPLNDYEKSATTNSGAAIEYISIMDKWEGEQW
ncbi:hypothetical protein [Niallia sp.]|uniref:hypothetical protein n=1 Tax=Niallia sp. TaxID=2837523 RepID=UPI002898C524|nr:hypothetical protein [Niallia sp.]